MDPKYRKPVQFCSFSKYRLFSQFWFVEIFWYVVRDFLKDLYQFYHRGRYGWSPRDTWNLDTYIPHVMGSTMYYLSHHHHGAPFGYPYEELMVKKPTKYNPERLLPYNKDKHSDKEIVTDFKKWEEDLHIHAHAFIEYAHGDSWSIEETELQDRNVKNAFEWMKTWFHGLWY